MQHYFNGSAIPANEERGTLSAVNNGNKTRIGFDSSQDRFTDGTIDDVRVYGRALNDDEVAEIVSNTTPGVNAQNRFSVEKFDEDNQTWGDSA